MNKKWYWLSCLKPIYIPRYYFVPEKVFCNEFCFLQYKNVNIVIKSKTILFYFPVAFKQKKYLLNILLGVIEYYFASFFSFKRNEKQKDHECSLSEKRTQSLAWLFRNWESWVRTHFLTRQPPLALLQFAVTTWVCWDILPNFTILLS